MLRNITSLIASRAAQHSQKAGGDAVGAGFAGRLGARLGLPAFFQLPAAFRSYHPGNSYVRPDASKQVAPQPPAEQPAAEEASGDRCCAVTGNCTPEQWWAEHVHDEHHEVAHHDDSQVLHANDYKGPVPAARKPAAVTCEEW